MTNAISTLVGPRIRGHLKWIASIRGADDCIYGIPYNARRVVKFDPVHKTLTEIGPDDCSDKWNCGVLAGNGCNYCLPSGTIPACGVLKIDTINGTVEILDIELPETFEEEELAGWSSGALAIDGCIYFMPLYAIRILKLNPEDDTVTRVGDYFLGEEEAKFAVTIAANNGYLYGISRGNNHIVRFHPVHQRMYWVRQDIPRGTFSACSNNGVLSRDGFIYALNYDLQILKIDVE